MIRIAPSKLNGKIKILPSKSVSHRAVLCAALADGESVISNIAFSDDILATLGAVCDMGFCSYHIDGDICVINKKNINPKSTIFCNESGSTLRFCLPIGMDGQQRMFTGKGRLFLRPLEPYENICRRQGIEWSKTEDGILLKGNLKSDEFCIRGDISSQFVSGLLLALPLLDGPSKISFSTPLESKAYVDLTMDMLQKFEIQAEFREQGIIIQGNQIYKNRNIEIEGDYSHAAFFAVGAAISGDVELTGLLNDSLQGDKQIFDILKMMGASVDGFKIKHSQLHGIDIDVSQIPDLVPILCVLACRAQGSTTIYNAARLRLKESDRLAAMTCELSKLGAQITEFEDKLVINGGKMLRGGMVDSHADHRIAMSLAIAACISKEDIIIQNHEVVSKSAPNFYKEFTSLGGIIV